MQILTRARTWLAVFKPAGLATIPGRAETDSVLQQVARLLDLPDSGSEDPRVRIVHRLDKHTSGALLLALDRATQRHFSHQFQINQVRKRYLAIVAGRPTEDSGVIDAPLARHPTNPLRMAIVSHGGRPAITEWRVESRYRDYALLNVFPRTGKTHQIRVHLASIGLPLAIDPLYNAPREPRPSGLLLSAFKRGYHPAADRAERPLIDRLTLHAEHLMFADPDGAAVEVHAPPPKDLRAAINMLGKYSSR